MLPVPLANFLPYPPPPPNYPHSLFIDRHNQEIHIKNAHILGPALDSGVPLLCGRHLETVLGGAAAVPTAGPRRQPLVEEGGEHVGPPPVRLRQPGGHQVPADGGRG